MIKQTTNDREDGLVFDDDERRGYDFNLRKRVRSVVGGRGGLRTGGCEWERDDGLSVMDRWRRGDRWFHWRLPVS